LLEVSANLEKGLIDADLGGGVIKQRLARAGRGKSAGYRLIICFRKGALTFFVYAYPKSSLSNIGSSELLAFKKLAKEILAMTDDQIETALELGRFEEIKNDKNL
jgi:hypothetical protein